MKTARFIMLAPTGRRMLLTGAIWLSAVALQAQTPLVMPDFGTPILRDWVQPVYPAEARKTKSEGRVIVEFVVEADGRVSREKVQKSSDGQFDDAALTAVRQWKFGPGVEEGQPAAMAMVVPVMFTLAQLTQKQVPLQPPDADLPRPMIVEPAQAMSGIDPDYPAELEERRLPGEVNIEFTVDQEGRARQPRVLWASHPAFVETALRALEKAEFMPAHQGPLPKVSKMQYPVAFDSTGAKPEDILLANHLEIASDEPPRILPQPLMLMQPVYPRDRLLAGEGGTVTAGFMVSPEGKTEEISIVSASAPEFGAAMTAAIETWVFKPAQSARGPIAIRIKMVHEFSPVSAGSEARLTSQLRPGGMGVGGAAGLDNKLKPLWRGFPVYPQGLVERQLTGEAQIEFIIDRDGRARLPKIVSATDDAFGWAAATAISQWVFERPTKAGEPVDVTVRIPVGFKPPKK